MASTGENLRTWLLGFLGDDVDDRVHQNHAPQLGALVQGTCEPSDILDFVWFQRTGTSREDECLDDQGGLPFSELFTIEIISVSMDRAEAIAEKIHDKDSFQGAFGTDTIYNGIFVSDQADDYEYWNPVQEFGLSVVALEIEVQH